MRDDVDLNARVITIISFKKMVDSTSTSAVSTDKYFSSISTSDFH